MNPNFIPILTTVISVLGSLIVAFGTWHVQMKNEREKTSNEIKEMMNGLQDDITKINSTVQTQIALIEVKIDTLSDRVNKHNNLIERTYKLEQESAIHTEQIKVANHRIEDLEKK